MNVSIGILKDFNRSLSCGLQDICYCNSLNLFSRIHDPVHELWEIVPLNCKQTVKYIISNVCNQYISFKYLILTLSCVSSKFSRWHPCMSFLCDCWFRTHRFNVSMAMCKVYHDTPQPQWFIYIACFVFLFFCKNWQTSYLLYIVKYLILQFSNVCKYHT